MSLGGGDGVSDGHAILYAAVSVCCFRCNRRGDSFSMYPNDVGMKMFTTVGAPCLETLSLVDKVQ